MWFSVIFAFFKSLNFSKWFGFIASNWKIISIGVVVAFIAYTWLSPKQFLFGLDTIPSLNNKIAYLEQRIKEAERNFDVCAEGNKKLADAIVKQNESIKAWSDLSKKIDESSIELKKKLEQSQQQSKREVEQRLAAPVPATCKDAMDHLRNSIKSGELSWQ